MSPDNTEETHVEWKALEHTFKQHSADWFWVVGTLALAGAVASIILGNTLFGLLILVGTIALLLQSVKRPKKVVFAVSEQGIRVGDTLYQYKHLDSFAVGENHILIKSKKFLMPYLILPFPPEEHENMMYEILETYLSEEEHEEPAAEKIMDQLGF